MLVSNDTLRVTEYFGYQATQRGVNFQPVEGSILSMLVRNYMANPYGASREGAIEAGRTTQVESEDDKVNRDFDAMSDVVVSKIKAVAHEINTARNVFKPLVVMAHEHYKEINAETNLDVFTPNIIYHRLPEIFDNAVFTSLIEQQGDDYDQARVTPAVDKRFTFPENIAMESLNGIFETPVESMTSRLASLRSVTSQSELLTLYQNFFVAGRATVDNVGDATILYFMACSFLNNLPEGCNGGAASFTDSLRAFRNRMASMLGEYDRNYRRLLSNGTLIVAYDNSDLNTHTITVLPSVYTGEYLRRGGTPETLLGSMMRGTSIYATVEELLDPLALEAADNKYRLVRQLSLTNVENEKARRAQSALMSSLNRLIDEILEGDDEAAKELVGNRAECAQRINAWVEKRPLNTHSDVGDYLIEALGEMLLDSRIYADTLRTINRLHADNNNLTPKQCVSIYAYQRTTDWMSQLMERVA